MTKILVFVCLCLKGLDMAEGGEVYAKVGFDLGSPYPLRDLVHLS